MEPSRGVPPLFLQKAHPEARSLGVCVRVSPFARRVVDGTAAGYTPSLFPDRQARKKASVIALGTSNQSPQP